MITKIVENLLLFGLVYLTIGFVMGIVYEIIISTLPGVFFIVSEIEESAEHERIHMSLLLWPLIMFDTVLLILTVFAMAIARMLRGKSQ